MAMLRWHRCLFGCGLLALLLMLLISPADSNSRRRRMRHHDADADVVENPAATAPQSRPPLPAAAPLATAVGLEDVDALLRGCGRLFIDGGSNTGESVRAFVGGGFFTCGLHSPSRQYSSQWNSLARWQRVAIMQPLREPSSFCIRSFEAAPEHMPGLRDEETRLRRLGHDVRFLHGALSNVSRADLPMAVARYAPHRWGTTALGLDFGDVHVGGKPLPLEPVRTLRVPAYDLQNVLRRAVALNASSVIALKLDVEGHEWWLLERLVSEPQLLCQLSYLFVEAHSTASQQQRDRLATYGLPAELFESLKQRVHAAMEGQQCRLKIYWRSFWASCGDKQRFEWRTSAQAANTPTFEPEKERAG